jgi:hypothetical protein
MPRNRSVSIYIQCILKYIEVGGASCLGNRSVKCFPKFIIEYIDDGGSSCPGNRRVKYVY